MAEDVSPAASACRRSTTPSGRAAIRRSASRVGWFATAPPCRSRTDRRGAGRSAVDKRTDVPVRRVLPGQREKVFARGRSEGGDAVRDEDGGTGELDPV